MKDLEGARHSGTLTEELLSSIAISLKRIADKLEFQSKQPIIMTAEEYDKYTKLKIILPDGKILENN